MRIHGPNEPVYTIGVAARLLGISPQTLRLFEREGLIDPSRTENNMRLYSQNELVLLQRICVLIKDEGLNLAGVRTVLRVESRYEHIIHTLRVEAGLPRGEEGGEEGGPEPEQSSSPVPEQVSSPVPEQASSPEEGNPGQTRQSGDRPGSRERPAGGRDGDGPWIGLGTVLALLLRPWP